MSFDPLSALFDLGKVTIERIWPDANKRAEELRKLEELRQTGDLANLNAHVQLMLGQIEVNKAEAVHKSIFVAGWRPFIGWVGGIALAYQFILYPILVWNWTALQAAGFIDYEYEVPKPMEMELLWTLLSGLLGIGAMRSFDKVNKVETNSIGAAK